MKSRQRTGCRRPKTVSLTALAIATLSAASAHAQSSIQLYGQVDEWIGSQKFPGNQRAWVVSGGGMSTSYWGMKGSEDLGGGYKAIFALEAFYRAQNGQIGRFQGDTFFARNAYTGIQSPYGTLIAGRVTSNLFVSTILFNPFVDSYVFSPMIYHTYLGTSTFPAYRTDQGAIGDSGWSNSVAYTSPNFSGLSGSVMYSFGNEAGAAGQHKDSAQLLYLNGALSATAVYQYVNYRNVANDFSNPGSANVVAGLHSQSIGQLGLTYDFKVLKLYGQYMYTHNSVASGNYHVSTGQAGFTVPIADGKVMASYAYSRDSGGFDQTRKTWAIGYDYPLSKRTDVYAAYLDDKISGESHGETFGIGIRAKF
ncbi:porin [Caballeronia ptereochthonis]|uniref:Porin n=1 Tax=Caballeronia ptereochthonis TaxID=1777144 RepID=A0A157ZWA4_9BURK|nr:porin [Caballeronia ptereochthonis]SAK49824.1 porin [Caballeronia ptereochthonis]